MSSSAAPEIGVQHLGAADHVGERHAGGREPAVAGGAVERFAGRDAAAQGPEIVVRQAAQKRPIGGRGRETDRRAEAPDGLPISSGVAFPGRIAAAPTRSGKHNIASPNVKAKGGEPMKRSSGRGFTIWAEKPSQMISMSRWKCIVPFGSPVVPDVKAIRHTSSAAVSAALNAGLSAAASASSDVGPPSPQ